MSCEFRLQVWKADVTILSTKRIFLRRNEINCIFFFFLNFIEKISFEINIQRNIRTISR